MKNTMQKKVMKLNKFDQLVDDLVEGRLSLIQIQIALRASIKLNKRIPEDIKNILCGEMCEGGQGGGLIYDMFRPIAHTIGGVELAYLRGKQNKVKHEK